MRFLLYSLKFAAGGPQYWEEGVRLGWDFFVQLLRVKILGIFIFVLLGCYEES